MQAGNIVWLASYPKSGNTWVRLFLSALLKGEADINKLKSDGIFSSRYIFEQLTGLESRNLYHEEIRDLLPDVFRTYATASASLKFVKVHDAYTLNSKNEPIIPADVSQAVVYLVRNPLDVAGSLMNHRGDATAERAVEIITDPNAHLATQKGNRNTNVQFSQFLGNWGAHVTGWTRQKNIPVIVIRYEDLLNHPEMYFTRLINFLQLPYSEHQIAEAVRKCSFSSLSEQENRNGFKERPLKTDRFFRKGTADNWQEELTKEQAQKIWAREKDVMREYGYDVGERIANW